MSFELAAFVLAVLGPLATGYFAYRASRARTGREIADLRDNHLLHLNARLDSIEARITRLETWMYEQRDRHGE